ncbi:MAG TPA: hypothetical protein VFB12_03225 [Ktedonobacteraceae bacterium]|nr:hypothetical protein [Ktedonobacteraceae bacterium]
MSVHVSPLPSRQVMQGRASGIFVATIFGAFWGLSATVFLSDVVRVSAYVLIGLVTLAFFGVGTQLLRYSRKLSSTVTREEAVRLKSVRRGFVIVSVAEVVLIVLAVALLGRSGASHFTLPVIALIVGVHFLPLARLFNVRVYYLTGALLSLLSLIALVALLLGLQLAGPSPNNWSLFVSVGAALVLWLTQFYNSRYSIRLMRQRAEAVNPGMS